MIRGETFIMDDGREITYEQMFEWLSEESLKQHGFYPCKGHTSNSNRRNNNGAIRNTINLTTIAAVTAATI